MFKDYLSDELRVVVVADWAGKPNPNAVFVDDHQSKFLAGEDSYILLHTADREARWSDDC